MLGLCATCAQAQFFFNLRDPLHSFASILTSVVPRNGNYYCTGLSWDSSNYIGNNQAWDVWGVRFAVYSASGVKLRDTVYQRSFQELGTAQGRVIDPWPSTAHPTPDGGFLVAADSYDYDSPFNIRAALIKLDTMGRCLSFREIDKGVCTTIKGPLSNYIRDLKPDGGGGWLLLSNPRCYWSAPYTHIKYLLTKLDGDLNVIWEKEYGAPNSNHIATKILVEPDGYVLAGGENNSNLVPLNFVFRAELIKTDTAGNVQWTWLSDPAKKIYSAADVVRTGDGGYLYCGAIGQERLSANGLSGLMQWKGWTEKLDVARSPQWSKTTSDVLNGLEDVEQRVIRPLSSGDYAIAGNEIHFDIPNDTPSLTSYGSLMRLAPDGTVRWFRRFKTLNDTLRHAVHDMMPTPDGGYIMVGQALDLFYPYTPPTQRGWLVKVDSNGCLGPNDPQCSPTAVPFTPPQTKEVVVYPNPATSTLNVRYVLASSHPVTILAYDLTGRTVLSAPLATGETRLNISVLPTGTYLWRIVEGGLEKQKGKFVKE